MSTQEIIGLVLPVVVGITSALTGVWALARQVKVQQADLAEKYQKIADKAISDVEEIRARVSRLERNVRARDAYIECLLRGIARLIEQIKARGETPVWHPEEKPQFDDD